MSRRPSFQFYPADWFANPNLKRCTHAEKGMWIDILCLFHDGERYGLLPWSLAEIARAIGATPSAVSGLVRKGVLKGSDTHCDAFVYTPRSGRRNGTPVALIAEHDGPLWYSSRMITDEYKSQVRGASLNSAPMDAPDATPIVPNGEAEDTHHWLHPPRGGTPAAPSSSSSTSSADKEEDPVAKATVVQTAPKPPPDYESDFQEFYDAYPLHKARGAALKAYVSARKKGASHEILVRGAAHYADHCRRSGTEKRFIAHPATWLNAERWNDDLSEPQGDPGGHPAGRPGGNGSGRLGAVGIARKIIDGEAGLRDIGEPRFRVDDDRLLDFGPIEN